MAMNLSGLNLEISNESNSFNSLLTILLDCASNLSFISLKTCSASSGVVRVFNTE
jgi:hypothetical protein